MKGSEEGFLRCSASGRRNMGKKGQGPLREQAVLHNSSHSHPDAQAAQQSAISSEGNVVEFGCENPCLQNAPSAKHRSSQAARVTHRDNRGSGSVPDLRPVFRSSPFVTGRSKASGHSHAKILFLDEGNCCRSVVAEAMFNKLLERMKASSSPLQASVESASLGPSFANHDPRVVRLANEAGLRLPPKTPRSFEDIKDSAGYDLILAMDRFDFEEVLKDVAVLDTINPGGFYSARIRLLGPFAATSTSFRPSKMPWVFGEGIEDPLYGNVGGETEQAALWGTLRKLRLACAGLAQFLHQLQDRCIPGTTLQQALSQALLCPLLGPGFPSSIQNSAWGVPLKEKDWRPVWKRSAEMLDAQSEPEIFTTRRRGGQRFIVRQPSPYYTVSRGYWTEVGNLERELQTFIARKSLDPDRLPTNRELRKLGANQLCNAIEYHGGFSRVAQIFRLESANRHGNGYWSSEENLRSELIGFVEQQCNCSNPGCDLHQTELYMPSLRQMKEGGRPDLVYAVGKWGGVKVVANLLGLLPKKSRYL